jgi:spore coat polysaccharide biosynthesis protein SpsF (cytidylyltransferase family)
VTRVVAILQARIGSTRLPGKVMLDLLGKPMLARIIERAKLIPGVEQVVVATTTNPSDLPLISLADAQGAFAFAGSEEDVLDRYYQAARQLGSEIIVRLTADCPLLDPEVSASVLARFQQGDVDYTSNTNPPTFPDGLDTEVFSMSALERAWREATLRSEREHVTPYIWKNPLKFRLANVSNSVNLSLERWTVDEAQDLEFVRHIYLHLYKDSASPFTMTEVLKLLSDRPYLRRLNAGFARNEGYTKSLRKDRAIW